MAKLVLVQDKETQTTEPTIYLRAYVATILIALSLCLSACSSAAKTRYRVTLIISQQWIIGEAKPCVFDGEYMEMHCFPPPALMSDKHYYLVDADFDAPVQFDANHWSLGEQDYPYSISCRLDSVSHATCSQRHRQM